jgi:hypothetical protein
MINTTSDLHAIRQFMWNNSQAGKLPMWTVYENLATYPGKFVACLHLTDSRGAVPTKNFIITDDLEILRRMMQCELHLTAMTRDPNDAPQIVETWL